MWILPKNYPLSSHFAQDMVALKEDLTLPGLNIEQSLMSRSKPTRLRTWQTRWKEGSYYQHLFGRILKPCQYNLFETKLTSSLAAIHVNHSVQQESDLEKKTQDTCGLTSGDTLNQLDLFDASLKTSKDTSVLDSEKSLATWKALVIKSRGEYSQRVKLALLTREKESTSWPTPNTMDHLPQRSEEALIRQATTTRKGRTNPSNLREAVNPTAVAIYKNPTNWATPRTTDSAGGARTLNEKGQRISVSDPTKTYGANLSDQVRHWPTPTATDNGHGMDRNNPRGIQQGNALATAVVWNAKGWWPTPTTGEEKYRLKGDSQASKCLEAKARKGELATVSGKLNPDWVEWLMGVPTGWTELGSWGTE